MYRNTFGKSIRVYVELKIVFMSKESKFIEMTGKIIETLPNTTFRVEIENGAVLLCYIAGRMKRHKISLLPGDYVDLEISPYDLTQGRIVYRKRVRN